VAVQGDHRGLGIGRSLLRYAVSMARRRGAERMILKVHPENLHARHLYESEGFAIDPVPLDDGQLRGTLLL
jgi:ribosomal protein S18 acetylase RimI-like enzyme